MQGNLTTLTERGQVSVPASLRRQLGIRPGQMLMWKRISDSECRVLLVPKQAGHKAQSARGFIKQFQKGLPKTTSDWMDILREGES
jgi:AbrB family looped-hinge helix DNA binding protein